MGGRYKAIVDILDISLSREKRHGKFLYIHCLWKNICRICRQILMLKVNCETVDPVDLE